MSRLLIYTKTATNGISEPGIPVPPEGLSATWGPDGILKIEKGRPQMTGSKDLLDSITLLHEAERRIKPMPPSTTKSLLTLVGTKFRKAGLQLLNMCEQNHPVLLVREPQNTHDPNAIAVYVAIGYIAASEAKDWAAQLDTLNPVGTVPGLLVQSPGSRNVEIDA